MKKLRTRKLMSMDFDHMRQLHEEAIEQLELMHSAMNAAEHAAGTMRDALDDMAANHWHAYLDVMHMVNMHDDLMATAMRKYGLQMRDDDSEENDRQYLSNKVLVLLLITSLIRRHRRFVHVWGLRGSPMTDYLQESMIMEREHTAQLVAMIQRSI